MAGTGVPWDPELFSGPALATIEDRRQATLTAVAFFDGLLTGEIEPLLGSFAGEPDVHHPVRGHIRGAEAFARFAADTTAWLAEHDVTVEDGEFLLTSAVGVEEFLLRPGGGRDVPLALAADLDAEGHMVTLRMYCGGAAQPPLLAPAPALRAPDVIGAYLRARATGGVDAALATFEPEGSVRDGALHRGPGELRTLFAGAGPTALELCAVTDDGRVCALEYNRRDRAGLAVHVRGDSGRLAAVRVYDS